MQRMIRLALVWLLALGMAGAAAAEEVKIGIVDIEQALISTDEGKAAREEITRKNREAQAQVEPLMEQRKALAEELQGKKYVLSDDAMFQKQVQLAELENKIKSKMEELKGQLNIEQNQMMAPLMNKLSSIIVQPGQVRVLLFG